MKNKNHFQTILKTFVILVSFLNFCYSYADEKSSAPKYSEIKERISYFENTNDPEIVHTQIKGADVRYERRGDQIEGVASITVPASANVVKGIISHYDDHDLFFKDVSGSHVLKREGLDKWWFYQKVNVPVIEDREFIVLVNDVGEAFYWYYLGPGKIKEGSLTGGNMGSVVGAWVFEPLSDSKKCKVKFYLNVQPLSPNNFGDHFVPDFVLDFMAKETFPNTIIALRDIVLHYDEWFDKDGNLKPEKRLAYRP